MSRFTRETIPTDSSDIQCAKLPGLCPTLRIGFVAPVARTAQARRVGLIRRAFGFDLSDTAQEIEFSELTEIGQFEAMAIESGDLLGAL